MILKKWAARLSCVILFSGVLSIVPAYKDPIKQGRGILKDLPGLTNDLLKERAKEREREDSKR